MNQPGNNSLLDMFSGLKQAAVGVDALTSQLKNTVTPEMLNGLPEDKRSELEGLISQVTSKTQEINNIGPQLDKAMAAATEMMKKAGF